MRTLGRSTGSWAPWSCCADLCLIHVRLQGAQAFWKLIRVRHRLAPGGLRTWIYMIQWGGKETGHAAVCVENPMPPREVERLHHKTLVGCMGSPAPGRMWWGWFLSFPLQRHHLWCHPVSVLPSVAYWIFLLNQISKDFSRLFKANIFKDKWWLLGCLKNSSFYSKTNR